MTPTTALASMLLLAAVPAAAQPSLEGKGPEVPASWDGLMATDGTPVFYSGTMIGLPSLTDTRPSSAGDLPGAAFFVITEPTVALNHLDFGAYEPYAPQQTRKVLEDVAKAKATNVAANDGINDVAVNVTGTLNNTRVGTSYTTKTGAVDWHAKAGVDMPGVGAGNLTDDFLRVPDVKVGMKYKF